MIKKRAFTLIEVSIAFSLIAIIVGLLMSSMRNTVLLAEEMGGMRRVVLGRHKCYTRLLQVFSKTKPDTIQWGERGFSFSFVNGFDDTMRVSGQVQGTLMIDPQDCLVLTVSLKGNTRKESLFPHVKALYARVVENDLLVVTLIDKEERTIEFPCFLYKEP